MSSILRLRVLYVVEIDSKRRFAKGHFSMTYSRRVDVAYFHDGCDDSIVRIHILSVDIFLYEKTVIAVFATRIFINFV